MSDSLDQFGFLKYQHHLSIESVNSVDYLKEECNTGGIDCGIVFRICFTCECLISWYHVKNSTAVANSYIEILNVFLSEKYGMKVKEDCSRLEGRLRRLCSETQSKITGKAGRNHQKFSSTVRQVDIRKGELVNINEVQKALNQSQEENKSLKEENVNLQHRCDELYEELLVAEALEKELQEKLQETYVDLQSLKNKNSYLHQCLDKIEEQKSFENTGGNIAEVKERQQRRKL